MKSTGVSWRAITCYGLVALGYGLYDRSETIASLDRLGTRASAWDVALAVSGSGYLFSFLLVPVAVWCALTQVSRSAAWENVCRFSTRSDWAIHQVRVAASWIAALTAVTVGMGLAMGSGLDGWAGWSAASASEQIVYLHPLLTPLLPHPALALALAGCATAVVLAVLTLVVAISACSLAHPRAATIASGALLAWALVSFPLGGPIGNLFGPATYAMPSKAALVLGLGPAGGVAVLLVLVPLGYLAGRAWEVHRANGAIGRPDNGARSSNPVSREAGRRIGLPLAGAAVILGLALIGAAGAADLDSPALAAIVLLQGAGSSDANPLAVSGAFLLTTLPAVVLHRDLVSALTYRRFAEMVRFGSPGRWLARHLVTAVPVATGYAAVAGASAAVSLWFWHRLDGAAAGLVSLWSLALALQVLVTLLALALGTTMAHSPAGGAYALGAAFALSWPLGAATPFSPFGQASLLRLANPWVQPPTIDATPIVTLVAWLTLLGAATFVLFSRTRGEIH